MIKLIKVWKKNRNWKRKYGMEYPVWADWDIMDQRIYKEPSYHQWLAILTDEQKKDYGEKMGIIDKALGKLELAIDDELIKRGNLPDVSK